MGKTKTLLRNTNCGSVKGKAAPIVYLALFTLSFGPSICQAGFSIAHKTHLAAAKDTAKRNLSYAPEEPSCANCKSATAFVKESYSAYFKVLEGGVASSQAADVCLGLNPGMELDSCFKKHMSALASSELSASRTMENLRQGAQKHFQFSEQVLKTTNNTPARDAQHSLALQNSADYLKQTQIMLRLVADHAAAEKVRHEKLAALYTKQSSSFQQLARKDGGAAASESRPLASPAIPTAAAPAAAPLASSGASSAPSGPLEGPAKSGSPSRPLATLHSLDLPTVKAIPIPDLLEKSFSAALPNNPASSPQGTEKPSTLERQRFFGDTLAAAKINSETRSGKPNLALETSKPALAQAPSTIASFLSASPPANQAPEHIGESSSEGEVNKIRPGGELKLDASALGKASPGAPPELLAPIALAKPLGGKSENVIAKEEASLLGMDPSEVGVAFTANKKETDPLLRDKALFLRVRDAHQRAMLKGNLSVERAILVLR